MKVIRFYKLREKMDTLLAYFDVELNGLRINDFSFRTLDGEFFIGVPKRSWKGDYVPIIEFKSKEVEADLLNAVKAYIKGENIAVESDEQQDQIKQKNIEETQRIKIPLTPEEKVAISRKYLVQGFDGSREDIKRMRWQHSEEMK